MTCPIENEIALLEQNSIRFGNPVASWVTTVPSFFSYEEIWFSVVNQFLKECYSLKSKAKTKQNKNPTTKKKKKKKL